jgi:hypothetical protein
LAVRQRARTALRGAARLRPDIRVYRGVVEAILREDKATTTSSDANPTAGPSLFLTGLPSSFVATLNVYS